MRDSLAPDTTTTIGTAFALAIGAGDRDSLLSLLAPDVQFRALTPGRAWEFDSAEEAVNTMLGTWFGGARHIDSVESVETGVIGGVVRVGYRFRATTPDGPAVVEQQTYLTVADDAITGVRVVCSGYHPIVG